MYWSLVLEGIGRVDLWLAIVLVNLGRGVSFYQEAKLALNCLAIDVLEKVIFLGKTIDT
jgi:hypothetical protein